MMFFDTVHTYHQLSDELFAHGYKVNKYLVFHDTEIYRKELWPAIKEYMNLTMDWEIDKVFTNNNGLLILKRL
jgi:hypothetical protein